MTCRHLERVPSVRVDADGRQSTGPGVHLCTWADNEAPAELLDTPRWLQNAALAGHLWRHGDCDVCPCFAPSDGL